MPQFQIPWDHSVFSGTENLKFLGAKIWALVPNKMKQRKFKLESRKFRNAIKRWKPTSCLCRLCKRYIHKIGFLNEKNILRNNHVFFFPFVCSFNFISL